ncbi:MAG: hypothetical protein ABI068_08395 [Ktedonobacterales bacterium]
MSSTQPNSWTRFSNVWLGFVTPAPSQNTSVKPHIRWWALVLGIIGIGLGIWSSFATNTGIVDAQLYVAAIATMFLLIIGLAGLTRFVLDVITTRSERGAPIKEPQV